MDYKEKVRDSYAAGQEEGRAAKAGPFGLEFHYTKKLLDPYITRDMDLVELGCGGGYYALHYGPRCRSYLGIDLSPVNVAAFQRNTADLPGVSAQVGDATDLPNLEDDSFDCVLCLGPMYHLNHPDRKRCLAECRRICKPGGLIALAFINKVGAFAKFGASFGWPQVLTPAVDHFVFDLGTDDAHPEVFFYTMPEEIQQDAAEAGLESITLAGLDFLLFEPAIEALPEEKRAVLFHALDLMHESAHCSGLANHAMLLCRKPIHYI
jgi:SAM-dependent methyltransferase